MKKRIAFFLLALTLAFQAVSFQPQKAHAVAGAATGNVAAIVGGSICLFLGGSGLAISAAISNDWRDIDFANAQLIGYSAGAIIGGIVLLDEESGLPSFGPLSEELINGAQLTEDEVMAYQIELPELNRAVYAAAADLAALGVSSVEGALAHGETLEARAAGLMPETRSALTKLGAYLNARAAN